MADPTATAAALVALLQSGQAELLEEVRRVQREENDRLFERLTAWVTAELDRREQYGAAQALLQPQAEEADEIKTAVAAKLLGYGSSNTLLQQMRREQERGASPLAALMVPGKTDGQARRFSRARVLQEKERRKLS